MSIIKSKNTYPNIKAMKPSVKIDVRKEFPENKPEYIHINADRAPIEPTKSRIKYIYIDDSGNPSSNDQFFILAATVARDPYQLGKTVKDITTNKFGDRKFANVKSRQQHKVNQALRRIDSGNFDVYIKIMPLHTAGDERSPNTIYRQTLDDLLKDILSSDPSDEFYVFSDQSEKCSQLILENLCTDDRIKDAKVVKRQNKPQMHTVDLVAGAANQYVKKTRFKGMIENLKRRIRS